MSANTILTSIVTGGSNSHTTTVEEANSLATDFVTTGVVGSIGLNVGSGGTGSFCVNQNTGSNLAINIKAGQAYITATPSSQVSQVVRARATSDYTAYTINSNSSGSTKYDWIYLAVSATAANNPAADASDVTAIYTSRSSSNVTDNGTPPTYGLTLAVVTVANGATAITNSNIQDKRTQASISTSGTSTATGWNALTVKPSSITANGNRSYSLVFNSTDLTGTLNAGMRLRTTRTSTAPTQSTSLNGTTQYYSKSSPAGMTFTNNFVVSAWVKLSNYTASNVMVIASRFNGTSGWRFGLLNTGQVELIGFNASSSNFSYVVSYQSLPLNKWIHVTAQLDMSTFTATTTTSYVMIDGVDVPASVVRAGTNPTALVQAGNLEIGSENAGTNPFPGKIAQVAIYSAKVTQANVLATISQGLAGTETSLISAYSFNNSINDLNANANNLTANGSAVATNADSPFGGQAGGTISSTLDYGIVQSVSFSTNTTVVVQVPEGCTIPTSGGVSAVAYSSNKVPYGFPGQRGKWRVEFYNNVILSETVATGTWVNTAHSLNIPIGTWSLSYQGAFIIATAGATFTTLYVSLSTSNTTVGPNGDTQFKGNMPGINSSVTQFGGYITRENTIDQAAMTVWYLNLSQASVASATMYYDGASSPTIIRAENAYV